MAAVVLANDPEPLAIAVYAVGFAVAFVLNLLAWWRLVTMAHVRRERATLGGAEPPLPEPESPPRGLPHPR